MLESIKFRGRCTTLQWGEPMKHKTYILVAILLIATLVRAYGIWAFPFEQDELYTIDEATTLFHTKLLPGIQAMAGLFSDGTPDHGVAPSYACGLASHPLYFRHLGRLANMAPCQKPLGRPRRIGRRVDGGYFAMVHLRVRVWPVLFPHLRSSSTGLLVTPQARDTEEPKYYLAALVPLLIGAWTHPSFVFPVAAAVLAVMLVKRDGRLQWSWPTRAAWQYLWIPFFLCSALIFRSDSALPPRCDGGEWRRPRPTGHLAAYSGDGGLDDGDCLHSAALGALVLVASPSPSGVSEGRRRTGVMILFGVTGMLVALFALSFVTAIYADYGIAALPLVFVAVAALVEWIAESAAVQRQGAIEER